MLNILLLLAICITTGFMIWVMVLKYQFKKRYKQGFEKLNTLYVLSNYETYFGYELMDFKKTVLSKNIEFCDLEKGVYVEYELTSENRKNIQHLTKEEQAAIRNTKSNPLTVVEFKVIVESIKASRQHMNFIREQEEYETINAKYKKANSKKRGASVIESMIDFQKELEKEEDQYNQKLAKLNQNLLNLDK